MPPHRLNGSQLAANLGQDARLLGRVLANDGQVCTMQMPDGMEILVSMVNPHTFASSPYVEVVGRVQSATELCEYNSIPIQETFDVELYNQVLQAAIKHSEIF